MPRDGGPSNPFIPAFCHSWNVASVTNIPPDRFSIGAFKKQVVATSSLKKEKPISTSKTVKITHQQTFGLLQSCFQLLVSDLSSDF
jgi:hypothetical protein